MVVSGWSFQNKWSALFGLWALQGGLALWQFLASQPSLAGLSFEEILLAGVLLFWVALNLFLIHSLSRASAWLIRLLDSLKQPAVKDRVFTLATLAFILLICLGIFRSIADKTIFWYVGYLNRLSPLFDLTTVILAEVIGLVLFFTLRQNAEGATNPKAFLLKLLVILAPLGGIAFYISRTGMGIDPVYKGDWARGLPAVPLLEWQILLACLVCAGMMLIEAGPSFKRIPRPDLWIALSIWVFAAALWLGQPIVTNSSALEPLEPNYEIYPFNDAQVYDEFAQSVLIGKGFGDAIPQRPLYIVFLVVLHILGGQDYTAVITLQSLVFALFPALLYLFGREFFGRPIGISIALLAILRDYTSNLVSPFTGNLSYSKVYLSEIPTAMLLILFLLVGIRWIKSGFPAFSGFLLGGILGTAMLIRTQTVVALPVLLLFAFLIQPRKFAQLVKGALPALLTMILVVSPWLWRNWEMTGRLIFDNPESQTSNLALRYNRLNGVDVDNLPLPGETTSVYNARLLGLASQALRQNPQGIVRGIFSSFLNHGVNNILLLPLRNSLSTFGELWTPVNAFWQHWDGKPTASQSMLLAFYVLLFGLGLSLAWQRTGWLGFLPLAVNLVYNLWTSIALLSGQRFMLSMDWSIYLYYMIGMFALLKLFLLTLERGRSVLLHWRETSLLETVQQPNPKGWGYYVLAGALFLGIGASLPLVASPKIFPQRYPQMSQPETVRALLESPALGQAELPANCLREILSGDMIRFQRGRALYPRYYEAGGGESFTDSVGYKATDQGRLVFTLLHDSGSRIVLPLAEAPVFFPHASDVTLVRNKDGDVWFAFVENGEAGAFYISSDFDASMCK